MTAPYRRALARGAAVLLFAVFLGALNAQPTPLILVGTGAPLPTLCTQQAVGNIYVRSQPPNNGPINVQRCTQTGLIAYAWMPIDHFVGPTLPTKCAVGDVAFDSDATAGQNLYGCTSADTWTAQAGSGGSTFDALTSGTNTTATLTVGTGGTLTLSGTGIVNANRINNTSMAALGTGPLKNTTTTGVPSIALAADIYGLWSGTCNSTTFLRGDGACNAPAGSGTVTVVSAGSLTDTALVTGGGSSTLQTAAVTATMDSSGNISTPGAISTGVGGSAAGFVSLGQGTAASAGTTNVTLYAPASVTSYTWQVPGAAATGFYLGTNTAGDVVTTQVAASGTGSVCLTVSCSMTTPAIGAATGTSLVVTGAVTTGSGGSTAGALVLGQGSAPSAGTTNITFYAPAAVTSHIRRYAGAAYTGIPFYTNTAGDMVETGQSLGTGVGTFLATPSSANLRGALTDESGTGAALFADGNIGAATGTSLVLSGALTSNALTSGRVTFAGASGILADDSDFTFSGSTATATNMAVTTGLTVGGAAITNNVVQNSQSAAYTTVLSDAGKHLYHPGADTTARIFTIDSNANVAYLIGTTLTFVNDTSGGVITIAITSDTMVLAGAGTTGSRTLAANGIATAIKMTSTRWMISGTGLT